MPDAELLRRLADHEEIRQCLMHYSRGIDRIDEALLRTVYWDDAVDNHGSYNGPVEGFITWVIPLLRTMIQTMHFLGNILIEVEGDSAFSEAYFMAFHRLSDAAGSPSEVLVAGRYVDRMERRNGEWRIALRNVVYDWFTEEPKPADWRKCSFGLQYGSHHYPNDCSYAVRESLISK